MDKDAAPGRPKAMTVEVCRKCGRGSCRSALCRPVGLQEPLLGPQNHVLHPWVHSANEATRRGVDEGREGSEARPRSVETSTPAAEASAGGWQRPRLDSRKSLTPNRRPRLESRESQASPKGPRYDAPTPLAHREPTKRARGMRLLYSPFGGAASEALSFPHKPDCIHCGNELRPTEARYGTGLCDMCYSVSQKRCDICKQRLVLKHLQRDVKLCTECYTACDKDCRMCHTSLELGQLHWNTGMCDDCFDACEKNCRMCDKKLQREQLHWGTGLCDDCYGGCWKTCRTCEEGLAKEQLHWGSGLCDNCFDKSEKACRFCSSNIALGGLHWRTGLCDSCWDDASDNIRKGSRASSLSCGSTVASTSCQMCKSCVIRGDTNWGTGLCERCFLSCTKECKMCKIEIEFGSLRWGTGLCDNCYTSCDKECHQCNVRLELGQLHWGTGLCDDCFDKIPEKHCRKCSANMDPGSRKWGTGICDTCYNAAKMRDQERRQRPKQTARPLSAGVRAAIAAQFVFYMAPGVMQPSLFTQLQGMGFEHSAGAIYAMVLTIASIVSMVAPLPFGLWAERRGEREVYAGAAAVGAVGGLLLSMSPSWIVFAMSWGVLSMPPAIRGVRAAFLARNVTPEDLSRAGQLASCAGLFGGFIGPLLATALNQVFGAAGGGNDDATQWPNGFEIGGVIAFLAHATCAVCLMGFMPVGKQRTHAELRRSASIALEEAEELDMRELCERCECELSEEEKGYATALCDKCYDSFSGTNYSFGRYRRDLLLSFCVIAFSLEVSMNAGVIATFQPIAVTTLGWGPNSIAAVNFAGAGLSVIISLSLAQMRLPERSQTSIAALLYCSSVLLFTIPPITGWRLVVGLMLGIKAQILFMSPFTAVFSRLIGRVRVTNRLTTALCLAPAIGGALGTAAAPLFMHAAGTLYFSLVSLPALFALIYLEVGWQRWDARLKST